MSEIIISAKAYCKIILHAAKYPHCAVNGVLLSKASAAKNKQLEFVDAVPLFHMALTLIPMAEIALMQIDELATKNGLVISGFYTAPQNIKECFLEKGNYRMSEKIAANFPSACLVVVESSKLKIPLDNFALKVGQFADGSYKPVETTRVNLEPSHTMDICSDLLDNREHLFIVDYDNHLDNIRLDWMNPKLNKQIDDAISKSH